MAKKYAAVSLSVNVLCWKVTSFPWLFRQDLQNTIISSQETCLDFTNQEAEHMRILAEIFVSQNAYIENRSAYCMKQIKQKHRASVQNL